MGGLGVLEGKREGCHVIHRSWYNAALCDAFVASR